MSARWETEHAQFEKALCEGDVIPQHAVTVAVSLDGALAPMRDGDAQKKREIYHAVEHLDGALGNVYGEGTLELCSRTYPRGCSVLVARLVVGSHWVGSGLHFQPLKETKLRQRTLFICLSLSCVVACGTLGDDVLTEYAAATLVSPPPSLTDAELLQQRRVELSTGLVIAVPGPCIHLRPVERVPRSKFGVVRPPPLEASDLDALVFPSATADERAALLEGMTFFTTEHTAAEGAGPMANQTFCLGCHLSSAETVPQYDLVTTVSQVSRASRSTPTNFKYTSLDPTTGGGRPADHLDAIHDTGQTAAFTVFGDYSPAADVFDPLDGAANPVTGFAQQFGGFVQHTRPSLPACLPDRIPPLAIDQNLTGTPDASSVFPSGFRRTVGERAAPPYIGRGLMEAVPNADILAGEDPMDTEYNYSSLDNTGSWLGCTGDCISGRHNEIPANPSFISGLGRFGLRANGGEILQFVIGGLQGELGLTSAINMNEINLPDINIGRPGCADTVSDPEVTLSTPFSERNFLRQTAPPEFGQPLLSLLESSDPSCPRAATSDEGKVQRGAELFGIDLTAFANRMVPDRMPEGGDGLDLHAINQADRKLDCAGCHTPVHRTGQSPADVGAEHLSYVWAPIFSDLLLHEGPVIDAERFAPTPRDPVVIPRRAGNKTFSTFDLPRNLADDAFSNFKAVASGSEFRTAPLMGLGRIGPPFLHDARVYLSRLTVHRTPAGTVTTNRDVTNSPLVVRTLDDALRAAIELHDLPAPDDARTPSVAGAGCPVPGTSVGNVHYGPSPKDVICPQYHTATSKSKRGEARESIRRFRKLSREDQQAVIEFLKQL